MKLRGRPPRREASPIQCQVLAFVAQWVERRGYVPTRREIGEALRIRATSANGHLQALARLGYIEPLSGARRIVLLDRGRDLLAALRATKDIPLLPSGNAV